MGGGGEFHAGHGFGLSEMRSLGEIELLENWNWVEVELLWNVIEIEIELLWNVAFAFLCAVFPKFYRGYFRN